MVFMIILLLFFLTDKDREIETLELFPLSSSSSSRVARRDHNHNYYHKESAAFPHHSAGNDLLLDLRLGS